MSGETTLTIIGNLTADPELRFTPSGAAVANFTVASTPRRFNAQTSQWEDGDTLFMRCSIWRQAAENVAESLTRALGSSCPGGCTNVPTTPKRARSAPSSSSPPRRSGRR